MRNAILAAAGALVTLAAIGAAPAIGQGATSALQGHDTDAPVDVASDRIEVLDRADRAVFSGNVVVRQGRLTLNAARISLAYTDVGGLQIERLDASGGVTVRSPSETARGDFAIYDTRNRLITMIGDVSLVRGGSSVNGGRLVIDLDSGRAVMDGSAAGAPPGTVSSGGRVTGTFTVPQRDD